MRVRKFRKRPVVIEAIRLEGNPQEVSAFTKLPIAAYDVAEGSFAIQTLEGEMKASFGDWIIKGIKGEFYPCKPATYEEIP
jgi:hypothetical protein